MKREKTRRLRRKHQERAGKVQHTQGKCSIHIRREQENAACTSQESGENAAYTSAESRENAADDYSRS